MRGRNLVFAAVALVSFFVLSCRQSEKTSSAASPIRFTSLPSSQTNLRFNNTITENDSVNLISNAYAYMGAGIGVGDFNNDGLQDIYFGSNQRSSKLFINKGNLQFEDITEKAGVTTHEWVTGISISDVNNDGFDDIYVCVSTAKDPEKRKNKLFINNGNLQFTDEASVYGLADTSYSTQAVFFDYDRDGDLDMYLLNHLMDHQNSNNIVKRNAKGKMPARDKLFRNNGVRRSTGHPFFEDVSEKAGIIENGYGLGVAVTDVNNDGWPDLYVGNDYLANDLLWLNNRNGSFSNVIDRSMKHQSYSSMGVDAADVNNDGYADIMALDMMPEENTRRKMMYSFLNYDRYVLERNAGYEPEFIRNMMQVNNGLRTVRDTVLPFFSEIGQFSGISETDWSWSVLMVDLDNDGYRDIHITNGLGRDMINSDFINFYANTARNTKLPYKEWNKSMLKKLDEYGTVELNNYCFHNEGGKGFSNVSLSAGIGPAAISNGCAYADLDNDGDLDLLVNNINKEAFLLRNEARSSVADTVRNFISVTLAGDSLNKKGIGSKLQLYQKGTVQTAELNPARGYLSTVDSRIYFGVGTAMTVDSLKVTWQNGQAQTIRQFKANSSLKLSQKDAGFEMPSAMQDAPVLFADITGKLGLDYRHRESFYYDYGYQQLLPQKYSQLGPFITQGDINGDGLIDFFVGGAANQQGKFFIQQQSGRFVSKKLSPAAKPQEDLGCILFDADGDKDLDLFLNSGGNEYEPGSANYLPRLYKNDGQGNFTQDLQALPQTMATSAQCVAADDYDGDGDLDLFIGGRITPRQYPVIPESYLLQNNNGKFSIQDIAPELQYPGMITAAVWTDFNGDKTPDLVIAGEWMPIRFFSNSNGKFTEVSANTGLPATNGQWRSLQAEDLDKDGDVDFVAGNLGLNNYYRASGDFPIKLFAKDLDGNGSIDPVMAYYRINAQGKKELYPAISRDQFAAQVPLIKKKFLYNINYASSDMNTVLSGAGKDDLLEFTCSETRTVWIENRGDGKFLLHALPPEAQYAPVNAIVCTDADRDGNTDIILAGNEYQVEVMTGMYDASYGLFLKGDGHGKFNAISPAKSGLIIDGDVKDLKILTTGNNEHIILAAVNDQPLQSFRLR